MALALLIINCNDKVSIAMHHVFLKHAQLCSVLNESLSYNVVKLFPRLPRSAYTTIAASSRKFLKSAY